jgi:uncharacterized protein (UPF0276 family)
MHYADLPTLGVGLAADVSGVLPNYRNFLAPNRDAIDYLSFGAHYLQLKRIKHYISDLVEAEMPIVFHPINFNVASNDPEDHEVVSQTADIAKYCNAVWTGQDVGIWTDHGQYLGSFLVPAVFDEASVHEVADKVRFLNDVLPCPFLIENPPVSFSLETMHILDFMRLVAEEADTGIVLDIGHLIGYQQATGRSATDMPLDRFPFDRVIEVHLAGLQFSQIGSDVNIIDQHSYPVHELCWQFLREHIGRMRNLKGLTLEQEFCEDTLVLHHLRQARELTQREKVF